MSEEMFRKNCNTHGRCVYRLEDYVVSEYISPVVYISAIEILTSCTSNLNVRYPTISIDKSGGTVIFVFTANNLFVRLIVSPTSEPEITYNIEKTEYKYHNEASGTNLAKQIDRIVTESVKV